MRGITNFGLLTLDDLKEEVKISSQVESSKYLDQIVAGVKSQVGLVFLKEEKIHAQSKKLECPVDDYVNLELEWLGEHYDNELTDRLATVINKKIKKL